MQILPNEDWTAYVVGQLHKYRIRNSELADKCKISPAYLSTVLNGNKQFATEIAAVKTRDHILSCLAELIEQRGGEIRVADAEELNYGNDT